MQRGKGRSAGVDTKKSPLPRSSPIIGSAIQHAVQQKQPDIRMGPFTVGVDPKGVLCQRRETVQVGKTISIGVQSEHQPFSASSPLTGGSVQSAAGDQQ